ncbi:MAG TPA: GNAT family N-acetyltransferase [Pirellulaceae bacterium]|nr:GNAT family N-acetyltransferase [Pirellulaceae bacterium]HMO93395.1 GNAT family N-acetyltransferase [Pirellulaceae bacterium]HMP70455.1 GNAT family N-acetyltransferase [Pirellulaceae bacterium]
METGTQQVQPSLHSEKILLRPFRAADARPLFELINDRQIAEFTRTIPYPYPEPLALEWIGKHDELWTKGKSAIFAICDLCADHEPKQRDTGATSPNEGPLVGAVGLEIDVENENAELGYWIGRPYWNRGLCTLAAELIVDFGFQTLGLHKIYAHHVLRNPASGRVLQKLGMHQEGILREHVKKWGRFEDIVVYGLVRPRESS